MVVLQAHFISVAPLILDSAIIQEAGQTSARPPWTQAGQFQPPMKYVRKTRPCVTLFERDRDLPNDGVGIMKKGTPAPVGTGTGAGVARAAPRTVTTRGFFYSPRPIATMGRGNLLSGVRRQQEYHSRCDKQSENDPLHGLPSFGLRYAKRRL